VRFLGPLIWLGLSACDTDLASIRGSTIRVGRPVTVDGTELELKIFRDQEDCEVKVAEGDVPICLPNVDRAAGEVRLGFQFRDKSDVFPMPISEESKDQIRVVHMGTVVQDGVNGQAYTVIPHDPRPVSQLFILVIDGSSSMWEDNRMESVREALLLPEVKDAFFPEQAGVKTGVLLLQFTDGNPQPVGGALVPLDNKKDYSRLVKNELRVLSGYTHLFNAITYASGDLLKDPEVNRWIDLYQAAPTIVALTDGFNNIGRTDTCRSNAERLELLLKHLDNVRRNSEDLRTRPTVFTVGLGRPLRPQFKLPEDLAARVDPVELCGKRYVDRPIDGDLETVGIDNASLAWIAARGGGFSFVKRAKKGLGEAFRGAAATRYDWFEVRYRVDPFFLRRSFKTTLRLLSYADAEASVVIHPSAWLDAPPGEVGADGWTERRSYMHTAALAMPAMGMLLAASVVGAFLFNTRRALFGRIRPPKRAARTKAPPPAPPPPQA
jgi:hypothetical protein